MQLQKKLQHGFPTLLTRYRQAPQTADPVGAIWRSLRQPWLLLILGLNALLLILAALIIPQVPAEISNDGPATSRWLLTVSAEYDSLGQVMQNLGLFDVLHSLLLRILFGLIGLVIAVHLADLIAAALSFRRLENLLKLETNEATEPLLHAYPNALYRVRRSVPQQVEATVERVEKHLQENFPQRIRSQIALKMPAYADGDSDDSDDHQEIDTFVLQERFLAWRSQLATYLRPLLMLGLLMALIPVWLIITFGWELHPPPLAPGEIIAFDPQGVLFHYQVQTGSMDENVDNELGRVLHIESGDETTAIPLDRNNNLRFNQVDFESSAGPPGLFIKTASGNESLILPGQSQLLAQVGLVFSGEGHEETVLIPLQFSALRIVRSDQAGIPGFVMQVLNQQQDAVGPPIHVDGSEKTIIELESVRETLHIEPMPSLIVEARYLPGAWLLLVALVLVVVGAISYWTRTGFLLVQISPWASSHTITIGQSDIRTEIEAIEEVLMDK
ncbi:MAG: hypothetical protein AAF702_39315 [Chloroflexota bacterium]